MDNTDHWIDKTNWYCDKNIARLLVGTKADLATQRHVTSEAAQVRVDFSYTSTFWSSGNNLGYSLNLKKIPLVVGGFDSVVYLITVN